MSHAANLRNRQQQRVVQSTTPAKRRKTTSSSSPSPVEERRSNGASSFPNGLFGNDKKLAAASVRNAKQPSRAHIDESAVTVAAGGPDAESEATDSSESSRSSSESEEEVSDAGESDEEESSGDPAEEAAEAGAQEVITVSSSSEDEDSEGEHEDGDDQGRDEKELPRKPSAQGAVDESRAEQSTRQEVQTDDANEPSFEDLIRARGEDPVTVDVSTFGEDGSLSQRVSLPQHSAALSIPVAASLGTVLTQALRTNDLDLLESCLRTTNLDSIRATIGRLPSSQAATLMEKLAERLHKTPGRAGSLMVWVQWTIVAHGGYLATQPAAMKQLKKLYRVVQQRAMSLQPLLALKGKLDMLDAQMQLRRNMAVASRSRAESEQEDEDIIYVEGEDDNDISAKDASQSTKNGKEPRRSSPDFENEEDDDNFGVVVNGIPNSDEVEEDELESSEDDDEDLIDDEAEESDDDGSDELSNEMDYDDEDAEDDDEESDADEEMRPAKQRRRG